MKRRHNPLVFSVAVALTIYAILFIVIVFIKPAQSQEFDVQKFLNKTYVTVGTGYKFMEKTLWFTDDAGIKHTWNDPWTARIEIGYQYSKNVRFGISHHSQWLTGWPLNDDNEYHKTEIFIDYTFTLGELYE